MTIKPHKGGVRVDMDAHDAHEFGCYFYRVSERDNPADMAKDEMLAIIRLAHSQNRESCVASHDCPEPVTP